MITNRNELNVELLRKIQEHITEEPDMLKITAKDQNEWAFAAAWASDASERMPTCGTAACIAGWALILTNHREFTIDTAARLLGLDPGACCKLFLVACWPVRFGLPYERATTPAERVDIACKRIDFLIETGY